MYMWAAWTYGCGTKAFVSLADVNDTWGTTTVTMISAIRYKKPEGSHDKLEGSQSPVTVYLKSVVMRRNVFDCKATDKGS